MFDISVDVAPPCITGHLPAVFPFDSFMISSSYPLFR